MQNPFSSLKNLLKTKDTSNHRPKQRVNNKTDLGNNGLWNNPFYSNKDLSKEQSTEHKSKYPWLFSHENKGVRWDFDPIQVRNLAQDDTWVGMLVEAIANEVAKTPWQITENTDDINQQKALKKSPFKRDHEKQKDRISKQDTAQEIKELIQDPNPDIDDQTLFMEVMADLLEIGSLCNVKAYPETAYDSNDRLVSESFSPEALMVQSPETFTKKYRAKTGLLDGFWQFDRHQSSQSGTGSGGRVYTEPVFFDKQEVIWSDLNPRSNRRYGLPPTVKTYDILKLLDLTISQEKNYFSRGMIASGFLSFGDDVDIKEIKDIKETLWEDAKGKPEAIPAFPKSPEYQKFGFNFKELQFLEREKWYAKVISSAFRVPMSVVGLESEEINRATFEQERGNFESNTLGTYLQKLERVINNQLVVPDFGDQYRFEFVPGASENQRQQISSRVTSEYQKGIITKNEARRQLGYDELDDAEGEEFVSQEQPSLDDGSLGFESKGKHPKDREKQDEALREDEDDWHLFSYQPSEVEDLKEDVSEPVKELWNKVLDDSKILETIERLANDTETQKSENELGRRLRNLIGSMGIVDEIKEKIETKVTEKVSDELSDLESGFGDIKETRVLNRIQDRDMTFVDEYADRMSEQIRETVSEGWTKGQSIDEIRDNLREKAEEFSDYQAERIARDQLQRATGDARNEFAKETEIDLVEEWLATDDNRTREAHREMSGKWKRPNEDYVVEYPDGIQLESFPGNSVSGINCRCDTLLKPKEEVSDSDHQGR